MSEDAAARRAKLLQKVRRSPITISPPKKPRVPKNVGDRIDVLYDYREEINALNRIVKQAEEVIQALRDEQNEIAQGITSELRKNQLRAGRGSRASFSPGTKPRILVNDWSSFYGYIKKHDAFELLHKRVTEAAVVDRLDEGEEIPGIEREEVMTYSLTKVGKKK